MVFLYGEFDPRQSITGLTKNRVNGRIALKWRSYNPEMKMMLVSSPSGKNVSLNKVLEMLKEDEHFCSEQLISNEWCRLNQEISICFVPRQQNGGNYIVENRLCRYTAFAYSLKNDDVKVFDCDNKTAMHRAFVDVTLPISYTVVRHQIEEKRGLIRKTVDLVDSEYYRIRFECENADLYKTGYVEYRCGSISIPVTLNMIQKGFFVKDSGHEPELVTTRKEIIDLRRV